jgi:hypothetical protein
MDRKLSPHFVWLFALVAVAGGVGIAYLTAPHGYKVTAGAVFAFVGLLACASAWLTRASTLGVIGPWIIASLGLAVVYFVVVKRVLGGAASELGVSGAAADSLGGTVAAVFAGVVLVDALVASIGGAVFGIKLRSVKQPSELLRRAA